MTHGRVRHRAGAAGSVARMKSLECKPLNVPRPRSDEITEPAAGVPTRPVLARCGGNPQASTGGRISMRVRASVMRVPSSPGHCSSIGSSTTPNQSPYPSTSWQMRLASDH